MDMIGSLQLRVMHHLWEHGACTVHTVHDALNNQPGAPSLAYTTILTVMRNLAKRNIVEQQRTGRSHVFAPLIGEHDYKQQLVYGICQQFFAGDAQAMTQALHESLAAAQR